MAPDESFLDTTPKSLHAVDGDLSGREISAMVHFQMPVSAEHQAVIAFELVCVDQRAPADLLDGKPQKGLCRHIGHDIYMNRAVSLQNAEDNHFAGSASSPGAFPCTARRKGRSPGQPDIRKQLYPPLFSHTTAEARIWYTG